MIQSTEIFVGHNNNWQKFLLLRHKIKGADTHKNLKMVEG